MKYLIILMLLFACKHKTVLHDEYPEGTVILKQVHNVPVYELVIETPQGLERVEVDFDFYNYIEQGDTIILPQ